MSKNQDYKYTEEFGYIPKEWNVLQLRSLIDDVVDNRGKTPPISNYGIPLLEIASMENNRINYSKVIKYLDDIVFQSLRNHLKRGDVLFSTVGNAGEVSYYDEKYKSAIAQNIIGLRLKKANPLFITFLLSYSENKKIVKSIEMNQAQPSIKVPQLLNLKFVIPTIKEQEKIAEVLNDVDSLIEKTQQLIDKKKNLKIATMQKLLTPKKDWETKELSKITRIEKGEQINSNQLMISGKFPVVNGGIEPSGYLEQFNTNKDTITISEGGNSCGYVNYMTVPFWSGGHCYTLLNISDIIQKKYLFYFLKNKEKDIMNLRVGSGLPNIQRKELDTFEIFYPKKEEQEKIAIILSDMDKEIENLERELAKYKDLKIGMMQELLMGKIRLTKETVEEDNIVYISKKTQANDEFKDAIIISVITDKFGEIKYPLGAFRRQKLSYLFKRHNDIPIDDYLKKAMGPYNSKIKYKGGENIALKNNYVKKIGSGLVSSNKIGEAKEYYKRYYSINSLDWLANQFKYMKNEELEVLTTVDYTIMELVKKKKDITVENIKKYISSDKEWKPKLSKEYFSDNKILNAINTSKKLFNSF